jgi:glycosyltransferase involved in cell wall biosynthesis
MALVSVIIAARNAEATLATTLGSVLRQTEADLEVLVVDDGSTDGTAGVAHGIGDRRVSVHASLARGASAARNLGLAAASGRYVSFLDADDLWTADKLRAQRERLDAVTSATVAYSWTILIDGDGEYLFAKPPSHYAGNVHRDLLTDLFLASGSNIMIDRARLRSDVRFDESLGIAEDWEWQLRLAREHEFVPVPAYHVLYRLVPGSRSARATELVTIMSAIARRELAFERDADGLRRTVDATIHEYVALQCVLRAADAIDLRTALAHWAATIADRRRLAQPRTYAFLGLLAALAILPADRRAPALRRLLRSWGKMFGNTALIAQVRDCQRHVAPPMTEP